MDELTKIIIYTLCAGACIPIGGVLANFEKIRPGWLENELRHSIIAFGGGVLLAAVSLVLIPEGNRYVDDSLIGILTFLFGGFCFFALERFLGANRREKPQFTAMLLDYIPESLAMGGAFAVGAESAIVLALFIGLQNIPEGFNAFRELHSRQGSSRKRILFFMLMLVPIGPMIAVFGWVYFSHHVELLGMTMLFASGGILYLIFQDIAPQSKMRRHWAPPLGAVVGFGVGMLGSSLMSST